MDLQQKCRREPEKQLLTQIDTCGGEVCVKSNRYSEARMNLFVNHLITKAEAQLYALQRQHGP